MPIICLLFALTAGAAQPTPVWQELAPGMQQTSLAAGAADDAAQIVVLRADPREWQLDLIGADDVDAKARTARDWAQLHDFAVVINAGMFRRDYSTHVGYLKSHDHIGNAHANDYRSVAAFDPLDAGTPAFRIFDLDAPQVTLTGILAQYASATQNLRLIRRPGLDQWPQQPRRWSEAALGEDDTGRILFIFCRAALSMHDLNEALLNSGIGIVAAQHLEGGPEAQLYLHVGDLEHEWFGSYETSFRENDSNAVAWPIPNVLGLKRKPR